ncbi:MAG: hypothetical protein NC328_01875 [Muribaculum sp.]|nr:hypothetical protein [Muribaculum sp.]
MRILFFVSFGLAFAAATVTAAPVKKAASASENEALKLALDHVQKVVVIDSINVPEDHFFSHYRLPSSAGRILSPEDIPIAAIRDEASMAFSNEAGDFLMWSQPDSIGTLRIVESSRLTDGSWQKPVFSPEDINLNGDADFPFLSADGSILYYASDGEGSIGGYDIFVAGRDTQTGEYLEPTNIGMPFNSEADDYMMALDEENGVGWWATTRNAADGFVTIYVYILSDSRENLDPDDENLMTLASLSDYKSTWEPDADYSDILSVIANITEGGTPPEDFHIPMPGGKFLTRYDELSTAAARQAVEQWLNLQARQDDDLRKLKDLRREYHNRRAASTASKIQTLEAAIDKRYSRLRKARSDAYKQLGDM